MITPEAAPGFVKTAYASSAARFRRVLREGPVGTMALRTLEDGEVWPPCPFPDRRYRGRTGWSLICGVAVRAIHTPGIRRTTSAILRPCRTVAAFFSAGKPFLQGFSSALARPYQPWHYPRESRPFGPSDDGLFPGHLMWVLAAGSEYIDSAHRLFRQKPCPCPAVFILRRKMPPCGLLPGAGKQSVLCGRCMYDAATVRSAKEPAGNVHDSFEKLS